MLAHQLDSQVIGTKARLEVGDTALVPLQSVIGGEMAIAQCNGLNIALDLDVEVRILDDLAVGAVGVDLLLDFCGGVPLEATHEDVALDLTVVVAHELFGGPAGVLGLTVGRHLCVMSMVVSGRKSVALKLSVGVWWKVAMVSRRH
jgi:hypothetical protein